MADENPFEAFGRPDDPAVADHLTLLTQTRPWLMLLGVLTGLSSALILIGALFVGGSSVVDSLARGGSGGFGGPTASGGLGVALLVGLGLYGTLAVLYGAFAYLMLRQGAAITRLRAGGGLPALADVLRAHRDFWRLAGIMTLVFVVLYCGGIVAVGVIGTSLSQTFATP